MAAPLCDLPCDNTDVENHQLTREESEILEFRFGFVTNVLCKQHYIDQFSRYKGWQKKCSDPKNRHTKVVKTYLKDINLEFAKKVKMHTECRVVPGQKLCLNCERALREEVLEGEERSREGQVGAEGDEGAIAEDSPSIGSQR